jgi:hypothetical protein
MKPQHKAVEKIRAVMNQGGRDIARLYDRHNARCREIPELNRPSPRQVCPYPGGFPV